MYVCTLCMMCMYLCVCECVCVHVGGLSIFGCVYLYVCLAYVYADALYMCVMYVCTAEDRGIYKAKADIIRPAGREVG